MANFPSRRLMGLFSTGGNRSRRIRRRRHSSAESLGREQLENRRLMAGDSYYSCDPSQMYSSYDPGMYGYSMYSSGYDSSYGTDSSSGYSTGYSCSSGDMYSGSSSGYGSLMTDSSMSGSFASGSAMEAYSNWSSGSDMYGYSSSSSSGYDMYGSSGSSYDNPSSGTSYGGFGSDSMTGGTLLSSASGYGGYSSGGYSSGGGSGSSGSPDTSSPSSGAYQAYLARVAEADKTWRNAYSAAAAKYQSAVKDANDAYSTAEARAQTEFYGETGNAEAAYSKDLAKAKASYDEKVATAAEKKNASVGAASAKHSAAIAKADANYDATFRKLYDGYSMQVDAADFAYASAMFSAAVSLVTGISNAYKEYQDAVNPALTKAYKDQADADKALNKSVMDAWSNYTGDMMNIYAGLSTADPSSVESTHRGKLTEATGAWIGAMASISTAYDAIETPAWEACVGSAVSAVNGFIDQANGAADTWKNSEESAWQQYLAAVANAKAGAKAAWQAAADAAQKDFDAESDAATADYNAAVDDAETTYDEAAQQAGNTLAAAYTAAATIAQGKLKDAEDEWNRTEGDAWTAYLGDLSDADAAWAASEDLVWHAYLDAVDGNPSQGAASGTGTVQAQAKATDGKAADSKDTPRHETLKEKQKRILKPGDLRPASGDGSSQFENMPQARAAPKKVTDLAAREAAWSWLFGRLGSRKPNVAAPVKGLADKEIKELTAITSRLPWNRLWEEGVPGATKALEKLRKGEKIVPDGISREAIEAYVEIARKAIADKKKNTEVQRIRLQICEELLKGM